MIKTPTTVNEESEDLWEVPDNRNVLVASCPSEEIAEEISAAVNTLAAANQFGVTVTALNKEDSDRVRRQLAEMPVGDVKVLDTTMTILPPPNIAVLIEVARMATQPERDAYDQYHDWHERLKAAAQSALSLASAAERERVTK